MAIEFSCKNCGTILRVPDEHLGKQARCPKCQDLNIVQSAASKPVPSSYPATPPTQPQKAGSPYSVGQGSVLPPGGVAGRAYQSAHRGGMILTFGIMAIVCNIAAIPGILAWVMGSADLKLMDAGRMDPEGRGITQAGMILGMIMSILTIIAIVLMVCYVVFGVIVFAGVAGAAAGAM